MALEAVMASEAVGGNMHMDTRVIKVADFSHRQSRIISLVFTGSLWPKGQI